MSEEVLLKRLYPWEHRVSAGLTLRGYRTAMTGRPVIHFLHGNGFCGLTYAPLLRRLQADYDLMITDLQGHGDSEAGDRFLGWNRTADLCLEAILAQRQVWGDAPLIAMGHSFGGIMSLLMLAQAPGLFRRALLLDPVLFPHSLLGLMAMLDMAGLYRRNRLAAKARGRVSQWPSRQQAFDYFKGRGTFRHWSEEALWAYVKHALRDTAQGSVSLKCPPRLEAEIFSSYPRRLWSSLKRVRTPTHILYGDSTYPFVRKTAPAAARLNPLIRSQQVAGGHCFMQEDPERVFRLVARVLAEGGDGARASSAA